jgi:TolB-like protein
MKVVLSALTCSVLVTSLTSAQPMAQRAADTATMTRIAVVEFTPGANAASMTSEARRHLQGSLSAALDNSRKFDVFDTRHTRRASEATLEAINTDVSTSAAVKIGKTLGVAYVLTGVVVDYSPGAERAHGSTRIQSRVVEVATGKVVHTAETTHTSVGPLERKTEQVMQAWVMKPAIDKLTAALVARR